MRRFWTLGLLLALAACREPAPAEGAVRVSMKYGSYTPACLRVTASDAQGNKGETDIVRSAFKSPASREVTVAVFRKPEWARELNMEVASFEASTGGSCSGKVIEKHTSPEPITVPLGDVAKFGVTLQARDDDADGHLLKEGAVAGTDCDDSRKEIHPGASEVCSETEDFDCDGAGACADSDCLDQACDDGSLCTENDRCGSVNGATPTCQGTPKRCEPPNLTCYTSEAACVPSTGECVFTQQPASTACNDNNACTSSDQCGQDAACKGTPSVSCNSPPSQCHESAGTCNATTGACAYSLKAPSAACDDANACTTNDTCGGTGSCAGEPLPPCMPSTVCHRSVRNGCPASAACTESPDPAKVGTPCTVAQRSGVCRLNDGVCSSFPYIPKNFDPDAIPAVETGLDLRISCGTLAEPVVFDSSGTTPAWTAPAGCTLPPVPTARIITQGGQETVVVPIRNFILDPGSHVKLKGTRPVILAVYGNATLSGALLANADHEVPGPGGNRGNCGPQRGGNGQFSTGYTEGSGGGGGALGTDGAQGGGVTGPLAGGGKGVKVSSPTLVPLIGGCQGGTGGAKNNSPNGGLGGAGGGALQVSVAGTLRVEHWVSVSGGGARGGKGSNNDAGGGGGGGSGGGLLLEAFQLELGPLARLTANGGSGSEGGDESRTGSDGNNGSVSSNEPATCPDTGGDGGPGKAGAAEGAAAEAGGDGPNDKTAGGGGAGGGMGIIQLQGFSRCAIDASCTTSDNSGCDMSPKVTPICPP